MSQEIKLEHFTLEDLQAELSKRSKPHEHGAHCNHEFEIPHEFHTPHFYHVNHLADQFHQHMHQPQLHRNLD